MTQLTTRPDPATRPILAGTLSVSEAAARVGLTAHTLRWYEREGLVAPVGRDAVGRRRYTEADLGWLALLVRLRRTGRRCGTCAGTRSWCGRAATRSRTGWRCSGRTGSGCWPGSRICGRTWTRSTTRSTCTETGMEEAEQG